MYYKKYKSENMEHWYVYVFFVGLRPRVAFLLVLAAITVIFWLWPLLTGIPPTVIIPH